MDGGSGLNLMYLNTLHGLGLIHDQLQSSPHPFYGVVSDKQYIPLVQVTLSATFGDASNYRTETLTFEVVDFFGHYHIILGQPCYVKFMAITNYAYLKLKIPGSAGVITVEAKTQRALDYEQDRIELAAVTVTVAKLRKLSLQAPTEHLILTMPPMSGVFKTDEDATTMQIVAGDPTKTVQIRANLDPK
jgi:hypothetical protein